MRLSAALQTVGEPAMRMNGLYFASPIALDGMAGWEAGGPRGEDTRWADVGDVDQAPAEDVAWGTNQQDGLRVGQPIDALAGFGA
ncbi:hypothetical protein ACIBL3_38995 [Kribbella sp. NPDC050124]|uniref:hypothetical protein n=1 Tax=Kribbella sp. NPDC050124 TaxID=3364114 RepID=UPI00379C935C